MTDPLYADATVLDPEPRCLVLAISRRSSAILGCDTKFDHLQDVRSRPVCAVAEPDRLGPVPTSGRPN